MSSAYAQSPDRDTETIIRQIEERKQIDERRRDSGGAVASPVRRDDQISGFQNGASYHSIELDGAVLFGPGDFSDAFSKHLNHPLSDDDAKAIVNTVTDAYLKRGYFLSKAYIAPDQPGDGGLRISVTEGFVSNVEFEGPEDIVRRARKYFVPFLRERPSRLASMERALMLINDMKGVTVKDVQMRPSDRFPNAHVLSVSLEYRQAQAQAYLDNRGTDEVGPLLASLVGSYSFSAGHGEISARTFAVPNDPEEMNYLSIAYNRLIGTRGIGVKTELAGIRINSGDAQAAFDRETTTLSGSVTVVMSLLRNRSHSLWTSVQVDFLNHQRTTFGAVYVEDRLRVFRTTLEYVANDKWRGHNFFTLTGNLGVDVLGASDSAADPTSRVDGDGQFVYTTLRLGRNQEITDNIGLNISVKGQYSKDSLPSSEEFILGGYEFGRGYDAGEISGDHGIGTSLSAYYMRALDNAMINRYRLYAFYDHGFVWNDNFPSNLKRAELRSYGAGFTLFCARDIGLSFEAAKPVDRDVLSRGDRDTRFFFSLSKLF